MQQPYTTPGLPLALFTDFEPSRLQRSGQCKPWYWQRIGLHAPWTFVRYVQNSLHVQLLSWWSIYEKKFRFAATWIVDLVHWTNFHGIREMGTKDRSSIEKMNPSYIALTVTAIHHCLLAWKTGKIMVQPEFGLGGWAQHKCNSRDFNHKVHNACTDVFHHLDADCRSSLPDDQHE